MSVLHGFFCSISGLKTNCFRIYISGNCFRDFAIFKDICNENIKYAGAIVARKGKIDPSSIETALTGSGKHSFSIDFMKDYCSEDSGDADLFNVIIAE